jgi:hypothetical protein
LARNTLISFASVTGAPRDPQRASKSLLVVRAVFTSAGGSAVPASPLQPAAMTMAAIATTVAEAAIETGRSTFKA